MGTETKSNSYTGQISTTTPTTGGNPKVMKDSLSIVRDTGKQSNQINLNSNSYSTEQNSGDSTEPKHQPEDQPEPPSPSPSPSPSLSPSPPNEVIVPFVPIFVEEADVIQGAKDILKVIRPNWDLANVDFKKFTDGITNKLVGCFHNGSNSQHQQQQEQQEQLTDNNSIDNDNDDDISAVVLVKSNNHVVHSQPLLNSSVEVEKEQQQQHNDHDAIDDNKVLANGEGEENKETNHLPAVQYSDNVVLVRVYGNKTDLLIDRKAETQNFLLLHTYGLAPSLYATFKNGLVYEYVPGCTLNTESVLSSEIWPLVACRMAQMHRVVVKNDQSKSHGQELTTTTTATTTIKPLPMLWKKTQSFLDLVPERFSDAGKHNRVKGTFLPICRLREEFNNLYKYLEALNSPIVFCHNDLLLGNVVYTKCKNTVNFIDYEYADYNFQAFDIGNHFAEMCGIDEVDYSRYPKREFQLNWLRVYLESYLQRSDVPNEDVELLYIQVNQFALAAHIFWTVWSLLQAEHSTIDFDYVDYAFLRYNEYLARKDEFLSLTVASATAKDKTK